MRSYEERREERREYEADCYYETRRRGRDRRRIRPLISSSHALI